MCLVPRVDNKMQAVRCHSMSKVTGDFPLYDVSKSVKEVKDDDPLNQLLQNCKVPKIIGGEVDCSGLRAQGSVSMLPSSRVMMASLMP